MKRQKEIRWDFKILYVVGILMVVAGHAPQTDDILLGKYFHFYAFHLAIFMFSSGYFFKDSDTEHMGKAICYKIRRWIIPLYLWNFIYGLMVLFLKKYGFTIGGEFTLYNLFVEPWVSGHQFMYNLGGWFVAPLFMIYILQLVCAKLMGKWRQYIWLVEAAYLPIGMIGLEVAVQKGISFPSYGLTLLYCRFFYFLPFYGLGRLYRRWESKDRLPNALYFFLIFCAQMAISSHYGRVIYYTAATCIDFDNGVIPFVAGMIGVLFWLRVSKIMAPALRHSKGIEAIANHTFAIMLHQRRIVKCVCKLFHKRGKRCHGFR